MRLKGEKLKTRGAGFKEQSRTILDLIWPEIKNIFAELIFAILIENNKCIGPNSGLDGASQPHLQITD